MTIEQYDHKVEQVSLGELFTFLVMIICMIMMVLLMTIEQYDHTVEFMTNGVDHKMNFS